jgi:hypothetical protein
MVPAVTPVPVTVHPVTLAVAAAANVTVVLAVVAEPLVAVAVAPAIPLVNVAPACEARVVPFVEFVNVTLAPATKPDPVTVTGVAVGVVRSTMPAGLTDVNAGSALTTIAPVTLVVPLSSVTERLYEPATVAAVDA